MIRRALAILLATLLTLAAPLPVWTGAALAQEAATAPDYAAWEQDATRAEEALEAARASNRALEDLRQKIVDWRAKFGAAQTANQSRIETLKGQITALGPVPAEGAAEAPEIAARRLELNENLTRLQAPGLAAVEAYSRADGIIREIDVMIRERQAKELLKLSPSPANPVNWPAGYAVLNQGVKTLWAETSEARGNPARRKELTDNLPVILLYLLIAGVLMVRGPGFFERLAGRMRLGGSEYSRRLSASFVSLGQVVLPVGGMFLLVQAIDASGMTGQRTGALIAAFPPAALAFFASRWLGASLFPAQVAGSDRSQSLIAEGGAEARFHTTMIGLLLAVEVIRQAFITEVRPPLSLAAQSVWAAPAVLIVAVFLFRLGLLLRQAEAGSDEAGEEKRFRARMRRLAGTSVVAIALLAPTMAVIGYTAAANALIWPAVQSLALTGLLILVQRFVSDLYALAIGGHGEAQDGLMPVLISFTLTLVAIPAFALIWGARVADLLEVWTRFRSGITVGETRISPTVFLTLVFVFAVGYMLTRLLQSGLRSSVLPKTKLDKGGQNAIVSGLGYVGIFLSAIIAITSAGIDLSSLAIVAGALSVGIGFGLQNIVSNFVSGIILLIERPISEGDWIEVGGRMGYVRSISVRSTRIETFDRTDVIVPNADLVSGVVTNWTRGNLTGRVIVPVGVAYGTDTRRVETILREIADAHPLVVMNPPPSIFFVAFGADSLNFEIRAILRDVNFKAITHSEMNHEIARRFAEEGIEIPFAQRDVWLRNPEALPGAAPASSPPAKAAPKPQPDAEPVPATGARA